jgi:chromate transporter
VSNSGAGSTPPTSKTRSPPANLLPGPASTQLAIYCNWRVRASRGTLVGGGAFIIPGLILILALAALFLAGSPPRWVLGAGAGAGAAVAAVAVQAGTSLIPASWSRRQNIVRWIAYLVAGGIAAASIGPWLVAVNHYHLDERRTVPHAVAPGQITPGPVVQTVAVVGYAAAGLGGALLASAVAFAPSLAFILLGAGRFDRIRGDHRARAFLDGDGPAATRAILGSAIPLGRALTQPWQYAVLAATALCLLPLRRGVVPILLLAGLAGTLIALAGGPYRTKWRDRSQISRHRASSGWLSRNPAHLWSQVGRIASWRACVP